MPPKFIALKLMMGKGYIKKMKINILNKIIVIY